MNLGEQVHDDHCERHVCLWGLVELTEVPHRKEPLKHAGEQLEKGSATTLDKKGESSGWLG